MDHGRGPCFMFIIDFGLSLSKKPEPSQYQGTMKLYTENRVKLMK